MSTIPEATHRFADLFEPDDERVFRITFWDQDILRLRCFSVVDPSIYGKPDQWTSLIVEPIAGQRPKFFKLFLPGTGLDFVESDITEIVDDATGAVLYSSIKQSGE